MRTIMFEDLVHFIGHKNLIIGLLPGEPLFESSDIIQGPVHAYMVHDILLFVLFATYKI